MCRHAQLRTMVIGFLKETRGEVGRGMAIRTLYFSWKRERLVHSSGRAVLRAVRTIAVWLMETHINILLINVYDHVRGNDDRRVRHVRASVEANGEEGGWEGGGSNGGD